MGERQDGPFQLSFNASLKIDFQGSRVTSDGGLRRPDSVRCLCVVSDTRWNLASPIGPPRRDR